MKREASKLLNCLLSNKTCFTTVKDRLHKSPNFDLCHLIRFLESGETNKILLKMNVELNSSKSGRFTGYQPEIEKFPSRMFKDIFQNYHILEHRLFLA
jgi:hypothetical protein